MSRRHRLVLLSAWPGLAQIWAGQEGLGLILAGLFATSLNLAVLSRFVWTEAFGAAWTALFATTAGATWAATLGYTAWWSWRCHPERHADEIDLLFREAQELYLRGRWGDSRRRIEQILARDESDADALMLLGTLHARAGQVEPARRAYRQCLEAGGSKWRWEVDQALGRLGSS